MPRPPLALLVVAALAAASPARAAFLIQTPTSLASDYNPGPFNGGTPYIDPTRILAGNDGRSGIVSVAGAKFTLASALPAGATITGATISFAVTQVLGVAVAPTAAVLTISGSASATTGLALSDFVPPTSLIGQSTLPVFAAGSPPVSLSFDVTSLIASAYLSGSVAAFFRFDDLTQNSNIAIGPYQGPSSPPPTLTIQFTPAAATVPEPSSVALVLIGGVVLGTFARRSPIAASRS